MDGLKAGAGKSEILFPEEMFPLEGFIKVHDNPCARILVLENGIRAALVSLELVMVEEDMLEELKDIIREQTDTQKEHIWIHVTHVISTPHPPRVPEDGGKKEQSCKERKAGERLQYQKRLYDAAVKRAVEKAARQAAEMKDALLGTGRGLCDINANRDIPTPEGWWIGKGGDGPSNKTFTLVRVNDRMGRTIGGFVNYGIKPCAIDNAQKEENRSQVSADVTGTACRIVEEEWKAPLLFFMGAAADQVPKEQAWFDEYQPDGTIKTIDLGVETGIRLAEKYGKQMGEDIRRTAETIQCTEMPVLKHRTASFRWQTRERIKLHPRTRLTYEPDGKEKEISIEALTLNDMALVAVKPEICCMTEKALKERSPFADTLLLVMINGGMKYMADRESCQRFTWEAMNSMLMPGAAERFVETAATMLKEAKKETEKEL